EDDLFAVQDKTNRYLRLREFLHEQSTESDLIVMTLPMPRKNIVSAPVYMAWLESLSRGMPPFLFVRGNQSSVLTFYS
uniref:SLC12A transporter C-terminal domain-containing protein n=1 Tax=Megaselia scalaris TaxID=36166 RepID=T1H746_MEGSC